MSTLKPISDLALKSRKAVFIIVAAATVISSIRVAFAAGYFYRVFECSRSAGLTCPISVLLSFLIGITVGLATSLAGLFMRSRKVAIVSVCGLVWAGIVYLLWFMNTQSVLHDAGLNNFSQLPDQLQHFLPLYNASWWDVAVLAMILLLFIWHITTAGPFLKMLNLRISKRTSIDISKKGPAEHFDLAADS